MCTHSIDDLLPHAPLHYAATGEMVKGSYNIIVFNICMSINNKKNFNRPKISQEFPNKFQAAETCQPSSNEHNIMEKAR